MLLDTLRDLDTRIKVIIGFILAIGVFLIVLFFVNRHDIQKVHLQNEELVKRQEVQIISSMTDYELAYNFILAHLPKANDEKTEEYEIMVSNIFKMHSDGELTDTTSLATVVSQFASAIKGNDFNSFIGLFDVNSYVGYINQFDSAEDKENALTDVMKRLRRDGSLQSATFINSSMNTVTIYLTYEDGTTGELKLDYLQIVDQHTKDKSYAYLFTTAFEEIIDQIKATP